MAAPSANISTKISPVSKKDVQDEFGKKISFILDGGESKIGVESTIVNLINKPEVLRLGGIPKDQIKKFLNTNLNYKKNSKIKSPGRGKTHYSPYIKLRLNIKNAKKNEAFILIKKREKTGKNYFYLKKKKQLKRSCKKFVQNFKNYKKKEF